MSDHILFEQQGSLGLVTLNRPQALNAVNADMARALLDRLAAWADDSSIATVAIRGVGKAFCAGGDIRAVYEMGADAMRFFKPEYDLCRLIKSYPKPYVALMDGITMGGGVGISIYGSHRIATPNTLWAMPECAIGFYPDIGATWFLPRLPGQIGIYLALTGARLGAEDLLALGIATGFVEDPGTVLPRPRIPSGAGFDRGIQNLILDPVVKPRGDSILLMDAIDRCFAFDKIENIITALETETTDWARQALAALRRASPTSLKVTLRQMRLGKNLTFDQAIDLEYRLTQKFLEGRDFFEGVRAALIDRDGTPRWNPDDLSAISDEMVSWYFE